MRNCILYALFLMLALGLACADQNLGRRTDLGTSTPAPDASAKDSGLLRDAELIIDTGQMDAATAEDAQPTDTGESRDASAPDALTMDADVVLDANSAPDASPMLDASSFPDAAMTCGRIGSSCASDADCNGLSCKTPQGICMPNVTATCGGFAGALCPASIPECHYYTGADYGPCFTAFEKNCVCSSAARTVVVGCP